MSNIATLQSKYGSADFNNWTKNRFQYYDYVRYPSAGAAEMQFFVQPLGGLDTYAQSVKTLEQTNLSESRSFGKVGFIIHNVRTHIRLLPKGRQPAGINNNDWSQYMTAWYNKLNDLMQMGVLVMNIGQKEFFDIPQPFITAPPAFGPTVFRSAEKAGAAAQTVYYQQQNDPDSVYVVDPEQLIEPNQTFSCKISFDNANSPSIVNLVNGVTPYVEVGVIFDGYVVRPMQ